MTDVLLALKRIISTYSDLPSERVGEASTLAELDVDSIFAVELILEIEQLFGVRLSLDEIVADETLGMLADRIINHS
ncbi:acyl carrier protein [Rathayibacter iranicus]|uniref:Acyl carrier protein n=2 Tax=Rathayibacter iranicus TaxID=59737 RepID=A0AAD1AEW0_9MICO|nr:acyl carrier protein [Rathayibacter iranicus]AZZ56888.1 acyl carrier protein [Rathayibacter iranicus]MWV29487.1 hypothetical protein [Rathayibacter iranicus NCPPB 2253 = VKM Ac-1602]PPI42401.1 hypothetical protein C5E09_13005 [Rathayibacter iranicus]PPI57823.1 hypothetical protein C5E08_13905 [Rathayibacter iranicus]PPI68761.1 hypothetical protein C5E01_12960 [Rathayibacter iranicus]